MTIRRRNKEWRHGMTERAVHQDTMILNVYAANKRTEKQTQQKGTEMKRETDKSVITAKDFYEYFYPGREQAETSATVQEKGTKTTWHLEQSATRGETHILRCTWTLYQDGPHSGSANWTNTYEGIKTLQNMFSEQNRLYQKSVTERLKKTPSNPWKLISIF